MLTLISLNECSVIILSALEQKAESIPLVAESVIDSLSNAKKPSIVVTASPIMIAHKPVITFRFASQFQYKRKFHERQR